MLKIYKYLIYFLVPFIKLNLFIRIKKNKEDKKRINERFGIAKKPRPKGNLIWIHAASIGEFNSTIGLINYLIKKNNILITTSTITAYYYCKQIFQNKVIHQYAPIDHRPWVIKFVKHWSPNLVIWIESDLWPNTIRILSEYKIRSILLNLRISPQSLNRWKLYKKSFSKILECFDKVFTQSSHDLLKIKKLTSKKLEFIGNLKLTSPSKKINKNKLKKIKKYTLNKKVILIASSHHKEEHLILRAINKIIKKNKNILLIIVPRHPNRSSEVLNTAKKYIPECCLESNYKIKSKSNCLISNSLGEMSAYYSASEIVILGGSFVNMGGHNPIEPARYKCSILTGPSIYNWKTIFEKMINKKACLLCNSEYQLSNNLNKLLKNNNFKKNIIKNAFKHSRVDRKIIKVIISNISPFLKATKNA